VGSKQFNVWQTPLSDPVTYLPPITTLSEFAAKLLQICCASDKAKSTDRSTYCNDDFRRTNMRIESSLSLPGVYALYTQVHDMPGASSWPIYVHIYCKRSCYRRRVETNGVHWETIETGSVITGSWVAFSAALACSMRRLSCSIVLPSSFIAQKRLAACPKHNNNCKHSVLL
jgi:hypothetical protein